MLHEIADEHIGGGGGGKRRETLTYRKWFYDDGSGTFHKQDRVVIDIAPYRGPAESFLQHEGAREAVPEDEVPPRVRELAAKLEK